MDDNVRQRAFGAILSSALFSWQTVVTLLVTGVLFFFVPNPFAGWQPIFWLILGAVAEGAFLLTTMTDPEAATDALTRRFENQFDLNRVKNRVSRDRLHDALEYRRNMLELAGKARGSMRTHLMHTVNDVNDWISHMQELALHIDSFDDNELVERDRRMVPQQLEKAKQRLEREADADVKRDLQEQVSRLEQQLANLDGTVNSVRRAEIQLENTLSSLGTVYAQMARLGTKEVDSGRAQRLRLEIQDEVASLQDTIDAMDEVHQQSLRLR